MDEATIGELITYLARFPLAGDVIPGTQGLRKLRWQRPGIGKRGGARVIYYHASEHIPIFLLYAYAKAKREQLTKEQERMLAQKAAELAKNYGQEG